MLSLTKAILLALYLANHARCLHALKQVKKLCKLSVHNPGLEVTLRSVQNPGHKPRRRWLLKCNQCAPCNYGVGKGGCNTTSAQVESTQHCEWFAYEFTNLCVKCIASKAKVPPGAVQQAGATQTAKFLSDEVTNLLSMAEQRNFPMQSEVLQISHDYLEMLIFVQSCWCQELHCAVGITSTTGGRTGMEVTNAAWQYDSAETVATQGGVKSSLIEATTTWMGPAWATATVSAQNLLRIFLSEVTLLSVGVLFFQVRFCLIYC